MNFVRESSAILFALATVAVACSPTKFIGGSGSGSPVVASTAQPGTGTVVATGTQTPIRNANPETYPGNTTTGTGTGTTIATNPTTPVAPAPWCANGSKNFKILIIDLKSGWFAGDGGSFFKSFLANQCNDKVQLEYVHLTKHKVEGNINQFSGAADLLPCANGLSSGSMDFGTQDTNSVCALGSITSFDELWVLSGADNDPYDLRRDGNFFASIKSRATELRDAKPTAGFFFGAGLSNADHANSLAITLFQSSMATGISGSPYKLFTDYMMGDGPGGFNNAFVFPQIDQLTAKYGSQSLISGSGRTTGSFDASQPVFKGLTSLFDYATGTGRTLTYTDPDTGHLFTAQVGDCLANPIVATQGMSVIATDNCGNPVIASATSGAHKILADGNVARFYQTDPSLYFQKIVLALLP